MEKRTFQDSLSIAFTKFIPVVILYSLLLVMDSLFDTPISILTSTIHLIEVVLVPILSVLLGYYLVGKKAVIPTFLIGAYAGYLETSFLGGLLVALLVVVSFYLMDKVIKNNSYVSNIIKIIFLILIDTIVFYYLLYPALEWLLTTTTTFLMGLDQNSVIPLVMILATLTALDMGGPFNKVSFAFSLSVYLEGQYHISGPAIIATGMAPLSIGLAMYLFPNVFSSLELSTKNRTLLLGVAGITEGAMPVTVKRPHIFIPANIISSITAVGFAAYFGLSNTAYIGALPGIIGTSNILLFLLSITIGMIIGALAIKILHTIYTTKKENKNEHTNILN